LIEILSYAHAKGNDFTEISDNLKFCTFFGRFKSDSGASMSVKGLIMIIIIMYSFMYSFSKLEHIDKNENQTNDTADVSVEKKPHYKGITDCKLEHTDKNENQDNDIDVKVEKKPDYKGRIRQQ